MPIPRLDPASTARDKAAQDGATGFTRRRGLLAIGAAGMTAAFARPAVAQRVAAATSARQEWTAFRDRYVAPEGRVIDTGNGGVSHSEGQGIGMLAAAQFGDRTTFDRLHAWTAATLRRETDNLHSWRYRPGAARPVDDLNNATDGDLLIAYALVTGAERWNDASLRARGRAIAADILRRATAETQAGLVLLPGAAGFTSGSRVTVNPSYYIFPALRQLGGVLPDPAWDRLWQSGLALLRDGRFGRWKLPPDWLDVSADRAKPADAWPPRFSFDAIRIPLYLTWAGLGTHPAVAAASHFWAAHPEESEPAWADLADDSVAPFQQPSGMVAVRRYVAATLGGRAANLPSISATTDYYAAALTLLSHLAIELPAPSA